MTDPLVLLDAISKADPQVGALYYADVAYTLGAQAAQEYKKDLLPTLYDFYSSALGPVRKRLGRSYVERVAKGMSPGFDPMALAAYEHVNRGLSVIGKAIKADWYMAEGGQRIDVYRDDRGRFARKSKTPTTAREEAIVTRFLAPGSKGEGTSRAGLPMVYQRRLAALPEGEETGVAGYRDEENESRDRAVTFGMQAHLESNKITDDLASFGVMPPMPPEDAQSRHIQNAMQKRAEVAQKLQVTADFVSSADGSVDEDVPLKWSTAKSTFVPPNEYEIGYAVKKLNVNAADPNDRETVGLLRNRVTMYSHEFGADFSTQAPERAGAMAAAFGPGSQNLDETRLARNQTRMQAMSGALTTLGFPRAGAGLNRAGQALGFADRDDVRAATTQAAYRMRGIEANRISAPVLSVSDKTTESFENDLTREDGFGDARGKYYERTTDLGAAPAEFEDAVERGTQRDRVSMQMWERARRRSSNAGLGDLSATTNYNALAQKISQGIGRGMPSEGVLMDADGNVVSQSMGITNDHFLPFTAESMKNLHGGQYVRTRQLGGITGEDVRTLLLTGGRSAQVVSGSGVYELEFDPSLRGGRRFNDRTLQMIDTYDRIVDEIAAGGHYAVPLPSANEQAAREQAQRISGGRKGEFENELRIARSEQYSKLTDLPENEAKVIRGQEYQRAYDEFVQRKGIHSAQGLAAPGGRGKELASDADEQAARQFATASAEQAVDRAQQDRSRILQLNSEGYALALDTLRQYYPYQIRTARYRSWEQMDDQSGGNQMVGRTSVARDRWRPSPGSLRPAFTGAVAGKGAAKEERRRARVGLPVSRAGRAAQAELATRVGGAGGRAAGAAGQAGGAGGRAAGMPMIARRADDVRKRTREEISSIDGLSDDVDWINEGINEQKIATASAADKARFTMLWFSKDPETVTNFLTSGSDTAQQTIDALGSEQAANQLLARRTLTLDGKPVNSDELQSSMRAVGTTAMLEQLGNADGVGKGVRANELPDGDSLTVLGDTDIGRDNFMTTVDNNETLSSALAFASTADSNRVPLNWQKNSDRLNIPARVLDQATKDGRDDLVRDVLREPSTQKKLDTLRDAGYITDEESARITAMAKTYDDSIGQRTQPVDLFDKRSVDTVRAHYALGVGLAMQADILGLAAEGTPYNPKGRGPISALRADQKLVTGKSLEFQQENRLNLLWSAVDKALGR